MDELAALFTRSLDWSFALLSRARDLPDPALPVLAALLLLAVLSRSLLALVVALMLAYVGSAVLCTTVAGASSGPLRLRASSRLGAPSGSPAAR